MIYRIFAFIQFSLFLMGGIRAQVENAAIKPFILGRIDEVKSVRLSETRALNIYLPPGYQQDSAKAYPVIYLLDGSADEDFIHVAGIVQFLNFPWVDMLPKSILVGIANVDRKRDFTFPTQNENDLKASPGSGHSGAFIHFLKEELQPYIQSHYRTTPQKTLIGESLGGLLATEILIKEPQLFSQYIIVSPSLWWNNESLLKEGRRLMPSQTYRDTKVYVAVGNEGKQMDQDASLLVAMLKNASPRGLKVYSSRFPKETHATVFHLSLYEAFVLLNRKH
jgi:uncharacterized protein